MALVKVLRGISLFLGCIIRPFLALKIGYCLGTLISSDPKKIGINQEGM
jgi:hypothetical protein